MSENEPIEEQNLDGDDLLVVDPDTTELQDDAIDDEHERRGQRDVEENIEAELDDRLHSHGEDRL